MKWGIRDYLIIPIQCVGVALAVVLVVAFFAILAALTVLDKARGAC